MSKLPTLQEITGVRPTCQCCHKPLKPYTSWFYMPGRFEQPPTLDEIQAVRDDLSKWCYPLACYPVRRMSIFRSGSLAATREKHLQGWRRDQGVLLEGILRRVWVWEGWTAAVLRDALCDSIRGGLLRREDEDGYQERRGGGIGMTTRQDRQQETVQSWGDKDYVNDLRNLAKGERVPLVSTMKDYRRVSRWWLGQVADHVESLEAMLGDLLREPDNKTLRVAARKLLDD